ncbi:MAG: hypothetical protein Q9188_005716, partial [Gyalolechia gomerana]
SPRRGHSCNAVGGSQSISIGGRDPYGELPVNTRIEPQESAYKSSDDPFTQGLDVFDKGTLSWTDHYNNAPPYVQSDLVRSFYGDSPQDGFRFSDVALRNLFQTKSFDSTSSTPGPSVDSAPKTQSSSGTSSIVGGAVGGTVGLVACLHCISLLSSQQAAVDSG